MRTTPRSTGVFALIATTVLSSALVVLPAGASAPQATRSGPSISTYLAARGIVLGSHTITAHRSVSLVSTPTAINTPSGGLAAISCPTTTFCVAMDVNGGAMTYNGSSWSGPVAVDGTNTFTAVSCPTTTFCAATDSAGNYFFDNSGTWSSAGSGASGTLALSISCPSTTYCVAAGYVLSSPITPSISYWDNGSWFQQSIDAPNDILTSVSCVSRTYCMGATINGYYVTLAAPSVSGPNETANITGPTVIDSADGVDTITSVSCVSSTFCALGDGYGDLLLDQSGTWHVTLNKLTYATNTFVSCSSITSGSVSGNNCIATDDQGETSALNGTSWTSGNAGDPTYTLVGFSCANDATCVAIDYNGFALQVSEGSSQSLTTALLTSSTFDRPNNVTAMSCTSTTFCLAGDQAGNAYVWNGTSWTLNELVTGAPIGITQLSCTVAASVNTCAVFDNFGHTFWYINGVWSSPIFNTSPITSNDVSSCSSGTNCVVIDNNFRAIRYSTPTTYTSVVLPSLHIGGASPTALSCVAGQSRCVALDSDGLSYISPGGTTWTKTGVFLSDSSSETATAISCPTVTFCLATDDAGNAYVLNGTTWGHAVSVTYNILQGVTCLSAYRCAAMDDQGNIYFFDGASWSGPKSVAATNDSLNSATCFTGLRCIATDSTNSYLLTMSAKGTSSAVQPVLAANRTAAHLVVSVVVTAKQGQGSPSGVVTLSVGTKVKPGAPTCDAKLSPEPKNAQASIATCTLVPGVIGLVHVVATYQGSYIDLGSGATGSTTVSAETSTTTLTLGSSTTHLGSENTEHLAVVVKSKHPGLFPSGSVSLMSGTLKLCTVKLTNGAGNCSPKARALAKGSHKIVAVYTGSAAVLSSSSPSRTLTVK